ncbi:hypothetical protein [Nitratiruptor tergarcus]|uniref:Uncharacterized protein n=1 Tax=Nitratiruptor tergarcus DSM 16512 TaxID=1069081 RepID=A0A1W1WUV5_9BACT|nr:hypothetical protein [Nitratiruptor tergarcus]SMC09972.1 hypothetical protein SAMN05660197_1798 [Nitratiruptor tergarcus DSM 16512]
MKYKIMDNAVNINIVNHKLRELLEKELRIYKKTQENENIKINIVDKLKINNKYSNNPSIHTTFRNGFLANFGGNKVLYKKNDNIIEIDVEINMKKNYLRKFLNISYRYNFENIGHIIHELILVPTIFFFYNKAIVHASSMKHHRKEKTILFGGTGGVGKTSLELLLCKELEYSFISDDIAIIDNIGNIYPNLSYPKIYAYNVINNNKLKKLIFKNKNFMDKLQWNIMRKLKGDSGVRRAISPLLLYNNIETGKNKIDEYYILYKTNTINQITIEKLNSENAAYLSLKIIRNEYNSIFQHIIWHEYNCSLMKYKPILKIDEILNRWLKIYLNVFKNIQCYLVKIPTSIDHNDFLSFMKNKFK